MAKLKNIIKQLAENDYLELKKLLHESGAEKSQYLLTALREHQTPDAKIMEELDVNTNAYYTLRSRLNQKIEEYLVQQMESPRTDLLKKVANLNEIVFTKKRAIAIATLKKLERELLDYDLSSELTVVYKALKKLHAHSPDYFSYSQLYNKHVAYMLSVDKAEDLLVDYFKKFGYYSLSGEEVDKLNLQLLLQEMNNVCKMYQSHRLFVYQSCMSLFHRLYVEPEEENASGDDLEPIEDVLNRVQKIFDTYSLDANYFHLAKVFELLRYEYYNHYRVYRKAEKYYDDVNDNIALLMANFTGYSFPGSFLLSKINRSVRQGNHKALQHENEALFQDYEVYKEDIPNFVCYSTYRALSAFFAGNYEKAANWINELLNEVSLKKYPYAQLEVKSILALQYAMMRDLDLFNQLVNSIQRQIRILGKENCDHIVVFIKVLKTALSESKRNKAQKIDALVEKVNNSSRKLFSPTQYIRFDEGIVKKLCEVD